MMIATTQIATDEHLLYLLNHRQHISDAMVKHKLQAGEFLLIILSNTPIGFLRWGYFWDAIPMMNLLRIDEAYRGQGYGRLLVSDWESRMIAAGYRRVLTSTLSDEPAQHFYRKLGYIDNGAIKFPDEALEILLTKTLADK